MSINEYNKQQDELFNYTIDRGFLRDFRSDNPTKDLEIVITPDCNLSCTYCYFTNHKDEIYPKEIRNHDNILNNIEFILNWVISNEYRVRKLNLFSGDIWHLPLGQKILELVYCKLRESPLLEL